MPTEEKNHTPEAKQPLDLNQTPLVEPEDGMFEAYSTVINFNWTLHDVRLRFGELIQETLEGSQGTWKDQQPVIIERAAITMPWHQAKYLCVVLGQLISNYEKLNGELKAITLPNP